LKVEGENHEVVVARDDGSIEVYSYDDKSSVAALRYENKVEESVTGIDVGNVTSPVKVEVVLSCYSGKVMSLMETKKGGQEIQAKATLKKEKQEKIQGLQKDVELLKKKQAEAELQERVQVKVNQMQAQGIGASDYGESFKVNYKMNIIPQEAAYSLFVDS